jgi:hypothetical protein
VNGIEEFLIGQHPVATFLVAVALGLFVIWRVLCWRARPKVYVRDAERRPILQRLPLYKGRTYKTDCTCAIHKPARVKLRGQWRRVCSSCGSLRRNTGT